MNDEDDCYRFNFGDRVKVYASLEPGVIKAREIRPDPRYDGDLDDAYEVEAPDGSSRWYFGRELQWD